MGQAQDGTSATMWGESGQKVAGSRGAWLKDSRFAMFIHWGLYSELAGEWKGKTYYGISEWIMNRAKIPVSEYEQVASRFNPVEFNALEWVRTAKAAGMRHIMITSKHHDGFAMFKSSASPYNIVDATPFKRDPIKELSEACRAEGLRFGLYYSQTTDWHEADAVGNTWDFATKGNFATYFEKKAVPQIREVMANYKPAAIWFDTPGPITRDESRMLVDLVHKAEPQCLVNSRIGNGLGDYETLGDMEIPRLPRSGLWETVDTHNDSWGYAAYDINFKSPREILERLLRVVSRGGVYMLNVGPDGKGRIPEMSVRVLGEVGKWVSAHESAIHGSGPTPFGPLPWGECTTRGNTLFLHVFQWPENGRLLVPGLTSKVKSAKLDSGAAVAFESTPDGLLLRVPVTPPSGLVPVVTLQTEGEVKATRGLYVLNGVRNPLDPAVARLTSSKVAKVNWMEKFGDWKHAECIGNWDGAQSTAAWDFRTVEPGAFNVDVEYTAPAEDDYSEWRLSYGGKSVAFPLIDTGERAKRAAFGGALPRFRTYRVGVIDLPKAGAHTITFGPTGSAGKGVRVASLILTPVAIAK
jgi:alpha-L-fucosidase